MHVKNKLVTEEIRELREDKEAKLKHNKNKNLWLKNEQKFMLAIIPAMMNGLKTRNAPLHKLGRASSQSNVVLQTEAECLSYGILNNVESHNLIIIMPHFF